MINMNQLTLVGYVDVFANVYAFFFFQLVTGSFLQSLKSIKQTKHTYINKKQTERARFFAFKKVFVLTAVKWLLGTMYECHTTYLNAYICDTRNSGIKLWTLN